jgi:two-component system phosphate regulon response regulator OmpR
MDGRPSILIVDDHQDIRDPLSTYIRRFDFDVEAVGDGKAMRQRLEARRFSLIVLDIMLPGEDGLSICRRLRAAAPALPIVMLTAKGDEVDRIVGLEMGADDYLPKPFSPRELVARINAVLRRRGPPAPPGAPDPNAGTVNFGPFTLNTGNRTLLRNGKPVPLTTGEFSLLKVLAASPGTPLSRDKLMELARGRELEPFDRSIDVQVSRLRKLVEDDPAKPRYIQTVWGFGYVFVPDAKR